MNDGSAPYDEERLPWLEEVEDEDGRRGISARAMLMGLLVVLIAAAVIAAVFFWMGRQNQGVGGAPELIHAPATPYKVKPQNPGGLDVSGESQTTFETSVGEDVNGRLDTSKPSGVAITPPADTEDEASAPAEDKTPPKPAKEAEEPSGGAASVVQLGAFRNTAQAERAWTILTTRFPDLADTKKIVVPYSSGGSRGFRLRAGVASPDRAEQVCRTLKSAGEACFVVR